MHGRLFYSVKSAWYETDGLPIALKKSSTTNSSQGYSTQMTALVPWTQLISASEEQAAWSFGARRASQTSNSSSLLIFESWNPNSVSPSSAQTSYTTSLSVTSSSLYLEILSLPHRKCPKRSLQRGLDEIPELQAIEDRFSVLLRDEAVLDLVNESFHLLLLF